MSSEREWGKHQRLLDYVWLSWTEPFWMGRLKDHLDSMVDYRSEDAEMQRTIQTSKDGDICQLKMILKSLKRDYFD